MLNTIIQIAIGGAIGALSRFAISQSLARFANTGFPIGTMVVNIVGSGLIGFASVYLIERIGTHYQPFIIIGLLGGFTTFSTFSLDTFSLVEDGRLVEAVIYVAISFGFSILALIFCMFVGRTILL
jgi:CrcB protein